jgi:hypothetical protein
MPDIPGTDIIVCGALAVRKIVLLSDLGDCKMNSV